MVDFFSKPRLIAGGYHFFPGDGPNMQCPQIWCTWHSRAPIFWSKIIKICALRKRLKKAKQQAMRAKARHQEEVPLQQNSRWVGSELEIGSWTPKNHQRFVGPTAEKSSDLTVEIRTWAWVLHPTVGMIPTDSTDSTLRLCLSWADVLCPDGILIGVSWVSSWHSNAGKLRKTMWETYRNIRKRGNGKEWKSHPLCGWLCKQQFVAHLDLDGLTKEFRPRVLALFFSQESWWQWYITTIHQVDARDTTISGWNCRLVNLIIRT